MLDAPNRQLLSDVVKALNNPFLDPINLNGNILSRSLVRQIERNLLQLRKIT